MKDIDPFVHPAGHDPEWRGVECIRRRKSYTCPYCGELSTGDRGYQINNCDNSWIAICGGCNAPTFLHNNKQYPSALTGHEIDHLPNDIGLLYNSARRSMGAGDFTLVAMALRRLLMCVAVREGAKENQTFADYVDWLQSQSYIPPGCENAVKHLKKKGNDANHEIPEIERADADLLLLIAAHLLRTVYELRAKVPRADE